MHLRRVFASNALIELNPDCSHNFMLENEASNKKRGHLFRQPLLEKTSEILIISRLNA
jgi:hypothetical protein